MIRTTRDVEVALKNEDPKKIISDIQQLLGRICEGGCTSCHYSYLCVRSINSESTADRRSKHRKFDN